MLGGGKILRSIWISDVDRADAKATNVVCFSDCTP